MSAVGNVSSAASELQPNLRAKSSSAVWNAVQRTAGAVTGPSGYGAVRLIGQSFRACVPKRKSNSRIHL